MQHETQHLQFPASRSRQRRHGRGSSVTIYNRNEAKKRWELEARCAPSPARCLLHGQLGLLGVSQTNQPLALTQTPRGDTSPGSPGRVHSRALLQAGCAPAGLVPPVGLTSSPGTRETRSAPARKALSSTNPDTLQGSADTALSPGPAHTEPQSSPTQARTTPPSQARPCRALPTEGKQVTELCNQTPCPEFPRRGVGLAPHHVPNPSTTPRPSQSTPTWNLPESPACKNANFFPF